MTHDTTPSGASPDKAKGGRPPLHKVRCNLLLDLEGHMALHMVAAHDKRTMSALVDEWAIREFRKRQWSNRVLLIPRAVMKSAEKLTRRDVLWREETLNVMADDLYDKPWYGPAVYRFWRVHRTLAGWWWWAFPWFPLPHIPRYSIKITRVR